MAKEMDMGASEVVSVNFIPPHTQVTEIECSCFVSTNFALAVVFVVFSFSKIQSPCRALAGPTLTILPGITDACHHAQHRNALKKQSRIKNPVASCVGRSHAVFFLTNPVIISRKMRSPSFLPGYVNRFSEAGVSGRGETSIQTKF